LTRPLDDPGMSIVARRGRVVAEPRSRLLRFERPADPAAAGAIAMALAPPAGGPIADDPRHELARLALDLVVRTTEPVAVPRRWESVPFGREVERTRAQLAPISTRPALAASFSREASIAVTRAAPVSADRPPGPVRVAYAIRWLELGDGRRRSTWASLIRGGADDLAGVLERVAQRIGDSTT
jgi:hypothetical protein